MEVKKFHSLDDLYETIKQDKHSERISNRRFPVRFIFINSFEELREIIKSLIENCNCERKEITELISDKNRWLTTDEIVNWVKGISNNAVLVPLSEFLRFQSKDDFYITLKSLTEIEKQNNIRIYIPLVGLWERFEQEFWANFYRNEEWAPVWKLETSYRKITIYQINFDLDYRNILLENFVVSNTEEWLSVWKKENVEGILSLSKSLSYFYKNFLPDQVFELKEISNQKEFLEEVFKIKVLIEFKDDEVVFWNQLIKETGRYNEKGLTIENIFLRYFNLGSIERLIPKDFLAHYLHTNEEEDYQRWLIRNVFLALGKFKSSYLYKCFESLEELKKQNLMERLWLEIFHLPPEKLTKDIFSERKEFLNFIHKDLNFPFQFVESKLANELNNIDSYPLKKKFEYFTSITFTERKYIISELKNVDNIQIEDIQKIISDLYPELAYYLNWDLIKPDNKVDEWIFEYFKAYNYSKIRNAKSPKIEELINNKNKNKSTFSDWYYSLSKEKVEGEVKYVWVDGLGAEWFPLIVYLINKYGKEKEIKNKFLTRVNLPSTTECNRYEFEKIEDLDNYVHNQKPYNYPDDLIKEIEVIEKIVKKIVDLPDDKVCIVSDHGFSFLCLKDFGNFKRLDLPNAEHEGRCMWIDEAKYKDDEYFIVWNVDEGNCKGRRAIVALKHVSLNNTPYREVHGGATPEEVLVPLIIIETIKGKTNYKVEPITFEVSLINPVIQFKISPHPLCPPEAHLNDQSLNILYEKEKETYKIDLRGLRIGTHTIMLKIRDMEYQINVTIKGGFKERDII